MNMGTTAIMVAPKKVERPRRSYKANQNSNRGVLAITEDKPIFHSSRRAAQQTAGGTRVSLIPADVLYPKVSEPSLHPSSVSTPEVASEMAFKRCVVFKITYGISLVFLSLRTCLIGL